MQIHTYVRKNDLQGVAREIADGVEIDCLDKKNPYTPLMYAVMEKNVSINLVKLLVNNGSDINAVENKYQKTVLELAVRSGNLAKIQFLLDSGADINCQKSGDHDVLIDAVCDRDIAKDQNLLSILSLLIKREAKVDGVSSYGQTALKIASHVGRFDAVQLLLKAGCDRQQLKWTPLMFAIACGSLEDVKNLLDQNADLSKRDYWHRTPWLLSIQTGDLDKAKLILASGADREDRGKVGITPLIFAIENNHPKVLQWLIDEGFDIEATDEYETTPLMVAAETGATDCVRILLEAGADPKRYKKGFTSWKAINEASNMSIVRMLVAAGEDLSDINQEMRRTLIGVGNCDELQVSREHYLAGKQRRFGKANPEVMEIEFWRAMIHCSMCAWHAKETFGDTENQDQPVWCYERFGRTITELPDGRIVEIAGEHEDFYDPDFCIYNDVVVYEKNRDFKILGYPKDIFPPTDFHSATLVGEYIYIIGNLGYLNDRISQETPVYKLNCQSFKIEKVETTGNKPGWISEHKALFCKQSNMIRISGGKIWREIGEQSDEYLENSLDYALDLTTLEWSQIDI